MNHRPSLRLATTATTAVLTTLLLLGTEREAQALGPVDIEVAAKAGVGSNPSSGANPFGFGLGGRAGISLLGGLYAGVNIVDYLGADNGLYSEHALQYGLEGGWGFSVLFLTIRPQIGIGNLSLSYSLDQSIAGASVSASSSYLYLEPGVTALITLGTIFIGADLNALIVPSVNSPGSTSGSSTYTSVTAHGQLGIKF